MLRTRFIITANATSKVILKLVYIFLFIKHQLIICSNFFTLNRSKFIYKKKELQLKYLESCDMHFIHL